MNRFELARRALVDLKEIWEFVAEDSFSAADGLLEDSSCCPNELFRLLGQSVSRVSEAPPDTLQLLFSNGDLLLLVDDSDQFESFVFTLRDRTVVI